MTIYHKIMVGFIALTALVFYYSAMRALKERSKWWTEYVSLERQLQDVNKQIEQLQGAAEAADAQVKGVRQLRHELAKLMVGRGRVWTGCTPAQPDANTGEVRVAIPVQTAAGAAPGAEDLGGIPPADGAAAPAPAAAAATPLELVENQVLYVFDERPISEGGSYLGEFRVASVAERQVALAPVGKLSPAEMERLTKATGTWALHDVMPSDNPSIFVADTPELREERLAILPESVRAEYSKDGQPAEPDDPPERVVDGKYQRPISDFVASFHEFRRQRSLNADLIAADQKDKSYLEQALADSQATVKFRAAEIQQVKADLAQLQRERNAVVSHRKNLDARLAEARKDVARLEQENRQLAEQYARWQSELAAELDAAAQAAAPTP
jgi:predicted  nucleic acid-binding Zn-ribbon protein